MMPDPTRDEWFSLMEQYPRVAFNLRLGTQTYDPEHYPHLLIAEPYIEIPEQWDPNVITKYQTCITWHSQFYRTIKEQMPVKLIYGTPMCNQYFELDRFPSYDGRINGVICLNKLGRTGRFGDIYRLRYDVLNALQIAPMVKHVWCHTPWGGAMYQGAVPAPYHSHILNLQKLSEYRFCLCFESTYHPVWSWDFITERMFNCFKTKTIAIYYGCYNIETHVPQELFIDYRQFTPESLSEYLLNFTQTRWESMTEAAYNWNLSNKLGSISDLKAHLNTL